VIGPARTSGAAYFVLAAALTCVGCGGSHSPMPLPIGPGPTPEPINQPPVVRSIEVEHARLEAGAATVLTAVVEDAETELDRLQYEWSAEAGIISGEGLRATWQAPTDAPTPADYQITLTVVEAYMASGNQQSHRIVLSSSPVRVHNSRAELTDLAKSFLRDFIDSSVSPSQCVRDFSDTCSGKRKELEDIERNRKEYTMLSASKYSVRTPTILTPWARAEIRASCEFHAKSRATGETGSAIGTCSLIAVYEGNRWWLCESAFTATSRSSFSFFF
jgi:hypothetical protein